MLASRWAAAGLGVHATHPGWADTPGVVDSLPRFHQLTGPLLRDAEGGADTTVWLAATLPQPRSGRLWHDRRGGRPTCCATRPTEEQRQQMWAWVRTATGTRLSRPSIRSQRRRRSAATAPRR